MCLTWCSIRFVEFNGAFIAGDWIGKAAQSRESDTLEVLLRILSILPCTIKLLQRSQLVSLLERLESEPWLPVVVKSKISAILADWNSSQEFQKGWLLYSASMTQNTTRSSKKKSSGPVSWVEDSKVVQVKEFSGEESDRSSDANDIVDTGLRHSSVSSILIDWHMPEGTFPSSLVSRNLF